MSLMWRIRDLDWQSSQLPAYLGILNVTPDSFSDGGKYAGIEEVLYQAHELVSQGANFLDVGGESTRPGASPVSLEEELRRVIPVIEVLSREISVPISVDTYKAEVARQALQAGASIVNDISGLTFDPEMVAVCREFQAGVVVMHIQGTPQTMQQAPTYQNVVEEVRQHLAMRIEELVAMGISSESIVIDPGIGFGKTAEHNLQLLAGIPRLKNLGRPVLIGHSRKRFLAKVLGKPVEERQNGTVGVSVAAAALGADILRLHEVAASRDACLAWRAVESYREMS